MPRNSGTGLTAAIAGVPYMASKLIVRQHLEDLNRDEKVIEYSLISPGMFMDYLAYPHVTNSKHTALIETFVNMQDMRGFYMKGHENDKFTVTAIHDIVNVVLRIIDYEGAWPVNGGVVGETVSFSQLIELGQKLRGKFSAQRLGEHVFFFFFFASESFSIDAPSRLTPSRCGFQARNSPSTCSTPTT